MNDNDSFIENVADRVAEAIDDIGERVFNVDFGLHNEEQPALSNDYATVPDRVIGDPEVAEAFWHEQQYSDTCAVVSQEFVLEELTGVDYSEDELAQVAYDNGWYTPGGGTPLYDVGKLLDYYGVPVTQDASAELSDIEHALENGQKVIVGVEGATIWNGFDSTVLDEFRGIPGQESDHAVEVIGVDYSDPDNPMVILNDPGSPDGKGDEVSMATFLDAWSESGNFAVFAGTGTGAARV